MIQITPIEVPADKMREIQTSTEEQVKEALKYIEKEMQKGKKVSGKKQQKKKPAKNKMPNI